MNPALDHLLCTRYPLIFAHRHGPHSCMARGFECDDGWFDILDGLCEIMQFFTDQNGTPQVIARQVKEKWGTLRLYIDVGSPEIRGMIRMAEAMSGRICEVCGKPGKAIPHPMMTRCPEHASRA